MLHSTAAALLFLFAAHEPAAQAAAPASPAVADTAASKSVSGSGGPAVGTGGFAEALRKADSARMADSARAADTAGSPGDSPAPRPVPRVFRWAGPLTDTLPCPEALEAASGCWREHPRLANHDVGFPGTRSLTLSLTRMEPVTMESPYFPALRNSPYGNGGILPPERYAPRKTGADIYALEDVWAPVIPLDTPVTSLEWERGALALNLFHLKLRRMLSDRVYLGLEYYSASADSQEYDYQFNVHQPYLGGWGFLGQLHGPIDRDSASLVLTGIAPTIDALNFRPRVGFWLDSNQVVELFLDRVQNNTDLVWPRAPGAPDELTAADSTQSLMSSALSAWTGGAVYGHAGRGWSSQWEAASTALEKATPRLDSTLLTGGDGSREDAWEGTLYRLRGRAAASGWTAAPWLEAEVRSETWRGDLFLDGAGRVPASEGWTDFQSVTLGLRPEIGWLGIEGQAGLDRSSRMDGRVSWLPRGGAEAALRLPWGLSAGAGAAYERRDPEWETLYRHNPALFLFPDPGLDPRADLGFRGSLAWELPSLRLGAGAGYALAEDAWLPFVLPSPQACDDLTDSVYAYAGGPGCDGIALADSLALRLRNWDRMERIDWHLRLGFDLGNWSLDLRNFWLLRARAEDAAVDGGLTVRSLPGRVFKGKLGWDRALVDGKLKVALGWGWEWFSTRYAWAPDLEGRSVARKLDEYLALDFQANMKIRTFLLYFKGINLNHDRYATEPGVHPPGVNFRFGIDWTIWN